MLDWKGELEITEKMVVEQLERVNLKEKNRREGVCMRGFDA